MAFARSQTEESINEEEFRRCVSTRIDSFFAYVDTDGDGSISRSELHQNVRNSIKGQFSPDKLFQMLNLNDDDSVTRQEFKDFFINLCQQQNQSP